MGITSVAGLLLNLPDPAVEETTDICLAGMEIIQGNATGLRYLAVSSAIFRNVG